MSHPYEFRMTVSETHRQAFYDFAEVVNPEGIPQHNIYITLTRDGNAPSATNYHHLATIFPASDAIRNELNDAMRVLSGRANINILSGEMMALVVRTDVQAMFSDLKWCMVARYATGNYAANEVINGGAMDINAGEILTDAECWMRVTVGVPAQGLQRYIEEQL